MVKDHGFREEKISLESYSKRVAIRIYSFQAWGAPVCRKIKGLPGDRVAIEEIDAGH